MVRILKSSTLFVLLLLGACGGSSGHQDVSCPSGQHDGGSGVCIAVGTCSSGYHDGGGGVCLAVKTCAKGYQDGGDGVCIVVGTCSTGYHDGGDGKCLATGTCSTGYRAGTGGVCVKSTTCASGTHDNGAGVCVADVACPTGYHDGGLGTCLPTGNCSAGYHDGGDGGCSATGTCSLNYHDGGTGTCVPLVACSAGYINGGDGTCMSQGTCAKGYNNGGDGRCVTTGTCSSGYHSDGTGRCVLSGCATMYHDDGAGKCVLIGCTSGFHDNGLGTCSTAVGCAAGYHDGGDGNCVVPSLCSAGYYDNGAGQCLKQPSQCAGDGGCAGEVLACISGYHNGGRGNCLSTGQCSYDYYDNGSGTCVQGSTSRSDASPGDCPGVSVACIAGYHYDGNGACVPLGACGSGFSLNTAGLCCMSAYGTGGSDAGVGRDAPSDYVLYTTDASPKNADGGTDVLNKQDIVGGGPAALAITPSSPSFTGYVVGCGDATGITAASAWVTITNLGGVSSGIVTLTGLGAGWQVWQDCLGAPIQPGASCQIAVENYTATTPGQVATAITIGDGVVSATATIVGTFVDARSCPDAGLVKNDGGTDAIPAVTDAAQIPMGLSLPPGA
jgi:hypothetical protein